ncbi:MAG: ABC transporter permease [Gemmatimonadales bacterium]
MSARRPQSIRKVSLLDPTRVLEGVGIALESIRVSKARAALTILGVAIGVMVVIGMASMITGINRSVTAMIEQAGPRAFMVMRFFRGGVQVDDGSDDANPWRRNPYLTTGEARMLSRLPGIEMVGWREDANGPASAGSIKLSSVEVVGATPNLLQVGGGTIASGRTFTQVEFLSGAPVALINDYLGEQLFPGLDPIGRRVKLFGIPVTVVGIFQQAASLFSDAKFPIAVLPHTTFSKVANFDRGWLTILVLPSDSVSTLVAQDRVIAAMRATRGLRPGQDNNFAVVTQDKLLDVFNQVTGGFFLVMLALSSVGLLVGGVGVIAIMMISVTERTREIGVRKALGATKREIMFQFLVEAATLTMLGGAIGMALGGGIAFAVDRLTPIPAAVPLWSVVAALAASVVTGVFFGLYPASKAARLDPVEALRWE